MADVSDAPQSPAPTSYSKRRRSPTPPPADPYALPDDEPAAAEVRKLVGEQLPELVRGYQRVPEPLRRVERNGRTPDQQLVDGLKIIDTEIAAMTQQLAQGDLDSLATRERYLQIKYQGEE